ncbi:MAG TPA: adenylate/guanylate cyclase domain-containing protein [Candidatus Limnocylindria bacterium]|nr:adenylate/guanylate cyclase domain-containing protein [Candidatus Limnocylindria bacterium]
MRTLAAIIDLIGRIGADPRDGDDVRRKKRYLAAAAVFVVPAGVIWGLIYVAFGEPAAGAIPLGYSVISTISIVAFARTRSFGAFRTLQLLFILLLPFVLQLALGGFVPASAVILWSLLSPFGALVFDDVRSAVRWFALFVLLVFVSPFLGTRAGNALQTSLVTLFFVLNIATVSTIVFVLLATFVHQLDRERARSEGLLLNVLPKVIADRLKRRSGIIADAYDQATILFADVVNSTPLTRELTPREMVSLLDEYVGYFDELALRHGLEKVRTIGDNWMGVAGVPIGGEDHARRAARMALDMLGHICERQRSGARCLEFRIGLNSGPVIGGVIGRSKFVFDIWGDPVNLASRMESTGVPGRIQVGPDTQALLERDFVLEPRGTIEVKGRGPLETWFLVGERTVTA